MLLCAGLGRDVPPTMLPHVDEGNPDLGSPDCCGA